MVIDAHHHLWKYDPEEYAWIDDSMLELRRDFLPADLITELAQNQVIGSIAVQARQSLDETEWLLDLAEATPQILGVVGWAPLCEEGIAGLLEELSKRLRLRGLRHVVQGEPDDRFILRADFNRGIRLLEPLGLRYDILIYERHLPQTIEFVDRHPKQTFILDHVAKPQIKSHILSPWKENLMELARRENVYCKASGMVTEANWSDWNIETLRPYWETVLEAFGPGRIMFGSDWPVLRVASDYGKWVETVQEFVKELSVSEQKRIWSGTAKEAYGIA